MDANAVYFVVDAAHAQGTPWPEAGIVRGEAPDDVIAGVSGNAMSWHGNRPVAMIITDVNSSTANCSAIDANSCGCPIGPAQR